MDDANNPLMLQKMHPVLSNQDQTKRERDLEMNAFAHLVLVALPTAASCDWLIAYM